jgi:hypothetical protein
MHIHRFRIVYIFLVLVARLSAQDFEVSPVLLSFNADPGEIQTKKIQLINHSSKIQKYNLKIADYVLDKDGNKKSIPAGSSKRSCADWITLNPTLLELNPNQTASIDAIITVPKNGFDTRWCMIYVEVAREQSSFEADKALATGVLIVPRIVILTKQTPKSNNNYKATIAGLKEVTKPGDKNRIFEVQVCNIGDNVIDGKVSLALANMQTTQEQKFTPVKVTVYPDATRTVKLEIPTTITKGKYALAAILDYGHRQPLSGTQMMLEVK